MTEALGVFVLQFLFTAANLIPVAFSVIYTVWPVQARQ